MRKVIAPVFVSLDGVMQAPGGPEEDPTGDFKFGGWTVNYWDDAVAAAMGETFARPFALLLGRKTYDIFAAHWPYVESDPTASSFDQASSEIANTSTSATKYAATRGPRPLSWRNTESLGADVVSRIRELKQQAGPDLLVQGSSNLIQTLLANDLIDESRLLIYPVVLGKGKRLFGDGAMPAAFKLKNSSTSPSGVLIVTYERAGEVKTGSFALETPTPAELERRKNLT